MIDIAYQGFGDGLEEDAQATRLVASSVKRCLIAASCSKNFRRLPRTDRSADGDQR